MLSITLNGDAAEELQVCFNMACRPADLAEYFRLNEASDSERWYVWKWCLRGHSYKENPWDMQLKGVELDCLRAYRIYQSIDRGALSEEALREIVRWNPKFSWCDPDATLAEDSEG